MGKSMKLQKIKRTLMDAQEGIQRNWSAALASMALIFIAMFLTGILILVRSGVGDLLEYLDSQITLKVYLDPSADTEAVASILEKRSFIDSVEVETGKQMIENLAFFFKGKEHLLESFQTGGEIEDAIRIELHEHSQMYMVAKELESMQGISKVVYPQKVAETILAWMDRINAYGLLLLFFFIVVSFGMVYMAINLALYQRQKEIRVKLWIGAKPSTVRNQFLFEGLIVGLMGSLAADLAVYLLFTFVLVPIGQRFPSLFTFTNNGVYGIMTWIIFLGSLVGVVASYLATRKLIKDA
ncbi:cell division protein FtsX [Peribacillus sp. NPDC097295]|uniref:cell division protein FtsX n=1 Tax=Peribacillus sp. NPDC097295 TaxID=3364402 RepID=UPI0037F6A86A